MTHICTKDQVLRYLDLFEDDGPASCGVEDALSLFSFVVDMFMDEDEPCPACCLVIHTNPSLFFHTSEELLDAPILKK